MSTPGPVIPGPVFEFTPARELFLLGSSSATLVEKAQVYRELIELEGTVSVGPKYILPIPTTELPSLTVSLSEGAMVGDDPFQVVLSGTPQPLTVTQSLSFPAKAGITYMEVQLGPVSSQLFEWDIPILQFEWNAVSTTGELEAIQRIYRIQKK